MTTIDKINQIANDIKSKSDELLELMSKSDDIVFWQDDTGDSFGQIISSEAAYELLLRNILGLEDYYSLTLRTPIESLEYEIEVEKILKKNCEDGIGNHQERIDDYERKLKKLRSEKENS